uniref:Centrosomal protein 350 n=1 Tax=Varanus komodoensis TaxID=61221 RepID=A0A8D2KWN8_VARKO
MVRDALFSFPKHSDSQEKVEDPENYQLQHIENKLEVAPTSTAVLDSVMDSKKPSAGTTRKISRKASRSSSQKKERSPRCPLRVTTLDSNVRKSGHVEFCEPLVSFRDAAWSPSYKTSCQPESRCLKLKDAGSIKKTEGMSSMAYGKGEQSRDFKSPSSADETVVRYLNDRPAIDALQSSDVFFEAVTPTRSEEEKTEGSRGDEYIKTSLSTTTQDTELKELQLVESSASSASTSSAHRLDILRNRQHDAKLEKLKERIRKQWEYPEELSSRGHRLEYADHPILVAAPENAVTPKVRKVATAPPGPSYKGFNSSEAKIRTPDGKVWREEEFLNLSRELCRDLELQLADWKEAPPAKTKERKAVRTVRKIQKVAHLPNPDSKPGYTNAISTSSWRDGQRLAKKLLGPTPKVEQQDKQPVSSDRIGKDRATKPGSHTGKAESDFKLDVTIKTIARSPERSRSKVRVENNTKKKDSTVQDAKLGEDHVNKDFLPVEIRGILDDLQLDSVSQGTVQERNEESQQPKLATSAFTRSHSPTKRKPDGLSANEEPQVTSKKRHYDTDEVRQYIARQQEERKKRQNEEKKAQKEATEQKNKRLQELYKKQREALAHKAKSTPAPESATKQLQATYSKLLLERTLLEEPKPPVQEFKPGYQPSGESDKENKVQERPPSASSSSDMSLSEPPHPLLGNNMLEPLWIQPDRLGSKAQLPSSQPSVMNGGLFSQLLSLDHMGVLQTDFDSVLSTRKSHSTAAGSMPLASQSFITSAVQPTINQYKSKLDRIEALKATAASLSSRIESEAKKLAGAGINHGALWNSEHNLLQGDQGDGNWAKACSSPVREDDVFSARLQKMLGTCISHTSFDDSLPGVGNLSEFKKLPDSLSPHTAAISLPGSHRPEGMPGNLTKKQTGSPVGESRAAFLQNGSVGSISEGPLSDGLLSEEEEERHEYPPLKMVEVFKEKEFCVANKTICEPIKEFQKEAEKFLPIFTQIRTAPKPWEDLCKGSPHSVINIFTKSYQLYGKGFEEWSGQGLTTQRPLLPVMSPSAGIVSYEDDFISSQGSGTATDKKTAPEPRYLYLIVGTYFIGSMRFSPSGLQHRMSAELNYLSAIEESMRQISDVERIRSISLAQQESVSLAQMLKAQQQRHERNLALLRLKAEQEALESQRQLEEARQKAAQAHAESQQQLVQSQQEAAEALQEATCKMAAQQVEAALLTTDAARAIREMTELARTQISDAINVPSAPVTTLFDQERKHHSAFIKQLQAHNMNRKSESVTPSQSKEETGDSKHNYSPSFDSYSESSRSKAHDQSSSGSRRRSHQESPSVPSSKETKKHSRREKPSTSIEEEAPVAVNDSLQSNSIPSIPDERDSASVATEYSLKFDESMTEDEIEEKSFRSLLPSESHRLFNLKKRDHRDYSDEEASPGKTTLSPVKELSLPFSGGQDSFSKFTMEMVRQYMKEEEMRAAHHSSLLRLREKALKEKTKAELAWLEHQKKRLRDKGEDDKMPPIRKKQRGLLLKLQQEKAEIKRLQEANKAARKERQLILKQQEEIERIRQTTMKLQEKLKSAGENKLEHRSEDDAKQTHSSSPLPTDAETCSPSSISSCETSSIMQKLKKMRSRMDEKFLTKREQKLMQRRQHAEELLQWKRRLDAEEAEIRQIEKQALAAWDKELLKVKGNKKGSGDQKSDQKETASEEESSVPACSRLNSESSIPEDLGSLAVESGLPKVSEAQEQFGSLDHTLTEEMVYAQERGSAASPGKHVSELPVPTFTWYLYCISQPLNTGLDALSYSWSDESLSMTQSETTSDQSDIESRIRALKDELRKRKSVVYQLKKEQKKRHKERLKAQEASLIKQLETYDEFIKKTEAELSRDLEATPTAKPQIKTPSSATEKPKIKPPPLHRSETSKSWKSLPDSERSRGSLQSIAEHVDAVSHSEKSLSAYTRKLIEAEIQTEEQSHIPSLLFKVPKKFRAESGDSLDNLASSALFKDLGDTSKTSHVSLNKSEDTTSCDSLVSTNKSVVQEEVESAKSEEYEAKVAHGASEKSDDSAFNIEQKHSPSATLKSDKLLEKKQVGLPFPQERKMAGECFDEDTVSLKFSQKLSKELQKGDFLASEQISICKEPFYSNSFEESSSREERSKNGTPFTDYCKDDFEAPALSVGKDNRPHGEKSWCTKTPRSRSASIGSDDEISECLSEKSLSVAGSIHSERLLELKSPTELMKSEERSDVEKERANVDLSLWASSSKAEEEEENALLDFKIGERVLVSNVQPGILRFKGLTSFAKGFWAGVELDKPEGNNNGAYNGIQYFSCKEKHGIFAPPHKISHISESFDNYVDLNKDLLCKDEPAHHQKDRESAEEDESKKRNASEKCSQDKFPGGTSALEGSHSAEGFIKIMSQRNHEPLVTVASEEFDQETSIADSLKSSVDDSCIISASVSNACREASAIAVGGTLESSFPEKWKQQPPSWQEYTEKSDSLSPGVLEKSATPLLDLLTKERSQLEAQLRVPSQEKEELVNQQEKVGLLAESLLQTFVKDTVNQLQQIKKVRNEKIQFSNQELYAIQERSATSDLQNILISSELDDGEEVSSPDMCPRPESPVFGASGQEELAKRLAELELSREFLSALGDDQDWFDEDFGLSSRKVPQEQAEESAVLPKTELPKVLPKPCEEPLAVPHTAGAVEDLVRAAAEELWKCKELGQGLQISSLPSDIHEPPVDDGIEAVSKHIYKQAVFDLTREIFGEIFAEDPNLNQPIWMKPCRITSGYFRRVKDPNDLEEIKSFITVEVLKLLNLKKEPNNKTDWQKMMKFGRKKRDRVDHILVQELHEEEAQWVNYDEDELQVKMQLADGIFEALIRETIDLLNQINKKQEKLVPL